MVCLPSACQLQYVGSTSDVTSRWSNTKGACLHRNSDNTRLYKHFQEGCPRHLETGDVDHLTHTLVDFMVTSKEKLDAAGHQGGNCRCSECQKLKDIEDKWMTRLGTLDTPTGLNFRDEIKSQPQTCCPKLKHKFTHHKFTQQHQHNTVTQICISI